MTSAEVDSATDYIRRAEEDVIRAQAAAVRRDGRSRVALVYGTGGVGKTTLVRHLVSEGKRAGDPLIWVPQIDVDDSEFWLLSNLETAIANAVDPSGQHFSAYFEHLHRFPQYADQPADDTTVLAHLGRTNRAFVDCYQGFVRATGRTVVIVLDTVEAIRAMYLLLTLVQWMKQLPSTLFVIASRPLSSREHYQDPIRRELDDPHQPLEHTTIDLGGFTHDEAAQFLDHSAVGGSLSAAEREDLIALTGGQPLWLALATDYLRSFDLPPEMSGPGGSAEDFQRRLVTPYLGTDFWSEAIKRLAVVRHSVNRAVWRGLMEDRKLPAGVTGWDDAWERLLERPWIRTRANGRYVTLHDALAEELAQRLIPLNDQDESWRRGLWRTARNVYTAQTHGRSSLIRDELRRASEALQSAEPARHEALVREIMLIDARKRELDQLQTAQLHYELLHDFEAGTRRFLALCDEASERRDPLFMELICHEIERFLPHGEVSEPLEDVLDEALRRFRRWLVNEAPHRYVEIAIRIAGFLIQNEQAAQALDLLELDDIPDAATIPIDLRYRLANERANACLRIAGRITDAEAYFTEALALTQGMFGTEKILREAEAQKELGFYYRNLGRWQDADTAYERARAVVALITGPGSPDRHRDEMASIQTNWAYLKALRGAYREARNLVDSAVVISRRVRNRQREGFALSVSGEVYRYEGKLARAWATYQEAEEIFHEQKSWPWLGVIFQEQAICLHQADREKITLLEDQAAEAQVLITRALDVCQDNNSRNYPSALNRAGRIVEAIDVDRGIGYLADAVSEALRIGDGWFYSSSLIEYVEMCYRAWEQSHDPRYRTMIADREDEITRATGTYKFTDLHGRWLILQGHLLVADSLGGTRRGHLDAAIAKFTEGFPALAGGRVASHGSVAVGREFAKFRALFEQLPQDVQQGWYQQLVRDWSDVDATLLLTRLEELY
jgi:tetratricopeptide (TPR) repeat protein/GTPase SAR1 family protein